MLADGAAVAVFHLTVHGGCPFSAGTGRQLRRFFKGQLLLHTPQPAARLVALIIHGAAQISLRRPAPVRHRVLQNDRHDPAFYDLEHGGLIVGDEDLGFHRQLQPGFPAPGVGGHGVLEHLEFHIRYLPFSGSINLLCIYMAAGAKKYPRRPKRSSGGYCLYTLNVMRSSHRSALGQRITTTFMAHTSLSGLRHTMPVPAAVLPVGAGQHRQPAARRAAKLRCVLHKFIADTQRIIGGKGCILQRIVHTRERHALQSPLQGEQ